MSQGVPQPDSPRLTAGLEVLLRFARPASGVLTVAVLLAFVSTALELAPFYLLYAAVESLVTGGGADLATLGLVAAGCTVARFVLWGRAMFVSHVAGAGVLHDLRISMAQRLARLPLGYFDRRHSGEVKKVLADDVERLELFLAHAIPELVSAVGVWLAVTVWLAIVDWRMALASIAVVPLAAALVRRSMLGSSGHMAAVSAAAARMNAAVVELLDGLPVVKVFDRDATASRRSRQSVDDYATAETAWSRAALPLSTAGEVLAVANTVVIIPVGLWLLLANQITVVTLLFFFIVGVGYSAPLVRFYDLAFRFSAMTYAGAVVATVMDEATLPDTGRRARLDGHDVEFRDVSFSYGGKPVLDGLSLVAREGEITALVGPSGAGKTTIARLVSRFWDVQGGAVLVGGVDVRDMAVDQLMEQVAFVFQDTFLFHDTVEANIRLGRPGASNIEVIAAARAAQAEEFISALPAGFQTVIGKGGSTLSGGERQRIAIARAILKDSPIVVLDEATAFTDPESEAAVQKAIGALTTRRTLVVVAHRLATVAGADQILVVDGGRIVQRGRHQDLVGVPGLYQRMWQASLETAGIALGKAVRGEPGSVQ